LARGLLDMLPRELASIDEPEERATEYLHYRQFFNVWSHLDRVVECQSSEASLMNKDTRIAWLKDYKVNQSPDPSVWLMSFRQGLIDQAYESIVKLLTSDWMLPDQSNPAGLYCLSSVIIVSHSAAQIADIVKCHGSDKFTYLS
jgi:nuclear pore complex protein Nup107